MGEMAQSQRELCKMLGISAFTLNYRRHQGWQVPSEGPYDVDALREQAMTMGFAGDDEEKADVKALMMLEELRLKKAKADTAEFELAIKKDEWVSVDEHNRKVREQAAAITKTIEAIPGRYADRLAQAGSPDGCRKVLEHAVEYVASEIAKSVASGLVDEEAETVD